MEAAAKIQALGDSPDVELQAKLAEDMVWRREMLAREILAHAPTRSSAVSALVEITDHEVRSDLIDIAALVTRLMTAQADEVMKAGDGKLKTPQAIIDAVDSLLSDFESHGLSRAECRPMHRRAHLMASLKVTVDKHNALIPSNLSAILKSVQQQDNGPAASVLVFDAIATHVSNAEDEPRAIEKGGLGVYRDEAGQQG